jgi:hypothetical protein
MSMIDYEILPYHLMAQIPEIVVLLAGLIVCFRARRRRPRVARLMAIGLGIQLAWTGVGGIVFSILLNQYGFHVFNTSDRLSLIFQLVVATLPNFVIVGVVWGCLLWAVLMINDWPVDQTAGEGAMHDR